MATCSVCAEQLSDGTPEACAAPGTPTRAASAAIDGAADSGLASRCRRPAGGRVERDMTDRPFAKVCAWMVRYAESWPPHGGYHSHLPAAQCRRRNRWCSILLSRTICDMKAARSAGTLLDRAAEISLITAAL